MKAALVEIIRNFSVHAKSWGIKCLVASSLLCTSYDNCEEYLLEDDRITHTYQLAG